MDLIIVVFPFAVAAGEGGGCEMAGKGRRKEGMSRDCFISSSSLDPWNIRKGCKGEGGRGGEGRG